MASRRRTLRLIASGCERMTIVRHIYLHRIYTSKTHLDVDGEKRNEDEAAHSEKGAEHSLLVTKAVGDPTGGNQTHNRAALHGHLQTGLPICR